MSISADRAKELLAIHDDIKKQLNYIDNKYTVNFIEPQIDFPESLGLEHIVFTEKTDAELQQLAEQQALPAYLSKKRSVDASYTTASGTNGKAQSELSDKHNRTLADMLQKHLDNCAATRNKMRKNGLSFSNLIELEIFNLQAKYKKNVDDENSAYSAQKAVLQNVKTVLDNKYQQQCKALTEEKDASTAKYLQELKNAQDKQKLAVDKYNASLDEREVKYKASCERTLEYARQAEYNRALEASRLYADLGETGFKNQMYSEKLSCCRIRLNGLTQEEAKAVIDADGAVKNHLGSYYSTLVQWIEDTLSAS